MPISFSFDLPEGAPKLGANQFATAPAGSTNFSVFNRGTPAGQAKIAQVQGESQAQAAPGGGGGPDLSNPVKRTDFAHSKGFDNYEQYEQSRFEEVPQFREPEFDIGPGLKALDLAGEALRGSLAAETLGITSAQTRGIEAEEAGVRAAEGRAGRQTTQKIQEGKEAVGEIRRQQSEIQQGIQARYGGTTGTGRFVSEIVGSQAMRNIASYRQQTKKFVSDIDFNLEESRRLASGRMADINRESQVQLGRLNASFKSALADLATKRAGLVERREEVIAAARQNYDNLVVDIKRRNTEEIRSIRDTQVALEQKLAAARTSASEKALKAEQAINDKILQRLTTMINAGSLTSTGLAEAEGKFGLQKGSLQTPTGKKKDEGIDKGSNSVIGQNIGNF